MDDLAMMLLTMMPGNDGNDIVQTSHFFKLLQSTELKATPKVMPMPIGYPITKAEAGVGKMY